MSDQSSCLAELREKVMRFARDRDWEQFHSPKNLSMAIAAEAGELLEHFLWDESSASVEALKDPEKARVVAEELADILIYALEFSNIAGIDVSEAIERKMAINERKYPVEKAKGNSRKYTEF